MLASVMEPEYESSDLMWVFMYLLGIYLNYTSNITKQKLN